MPENKFELVLDGVPYSVSANAFNYNDEVRYNVHYNGNAHVFAWDPRLGRLAPLDDDSFEIPDNLEAAIAQRLQNFRT